MSEGLKENDQNIIFNKFKNALKRPWKDVFYQYIAHYDEGNGVQSYDNVKTTIGFKQSEWEQVKDKLKGDAWKEKFYSLWDEAILRTVDKAMVFFELDRRIAGVSDNDIAIALKSKGYSVKYTDRQYFRKAAQSVKGMIQ